MTAALDAIRARHTVRTTWGGRGYCAGCDKTVSDEGCDAAQLLAALDRAEAVVVALEHIVAPIRWLRISADDIEDALRRVGPTGDDIEAYIKVAASNMAVARRRLRAYEDADKVADG